MVDDIAAGLYRIPIGPGAINNRALKPKSVTAGTISVSDLESVNAKTGNLTANGTITVNSTGSIAIGKTSYADDSTGGMWVGYSGGTYKLNLGNSTYSVKWDGSALNITGNITATDKVELKANCRMVGDIKAPRILIADGAPFKGNVDMD